MVEQWSPSLSLWLTLHDIKQELEVLLQSEPRLAKLNQVTLDLFNRITNQSLAVQLSSVIINLLYQTLIAVLSLLWP